MNKTINVGIVGYGNLGHALEEDLIANERINLVSIFSKRDVRSPFNTHVENLANIEMYAGKIDVMLLCGGSYDEEEELALSVLKNFNIIDCFDTHAKMQEYCLKLNETAKANNKVALFACGWDPGIFSVMRCYFDSISQCKSQTFWGEGISQGHTNALKQMDGIVDALQYTIPNKKLLKNYLKNGIAPSDDRQKHLRLCYVVKDKALSKKEIVKTIKSTPNYFEGYKVKIKFVSQEKLNKLKPNKSHKGQVINKFTISQKNFDLNFSLDLDSNPAFTSRVMSTLLDAVLHFKRGKKYGAYSMLDIPPKYLCKDNDYIKYL